MKRHFGGPLANRTRFKVGRRLLLLLRAAILHPPEVQVQVQQCDLWILPALLAKLPLPHPPVPALLLLLLLIVLQLMR